MHQLIVGLLLLLSLHTTTSALGLEYKGGFSVTNQRGTGVLEGNKPQFGGIYGLGIVCEVTNTFIIQPELIYTKKGVQYEDKDDITYRYFSIPLHVKKLFEMSSSVWSLYVGPEISYAISARAGESLIQSDKLPTDSYNRFDAGISWGGTMAISPTGANYIFIELRYIMGFISTSLDGNAETKNGSLSFMIGAGIEGIL